MIATRHIPTFLTMEFVMDADHRMSFGAWINNTIHATYLRKCSNGCHLVFKYKRKHISSLSQFRHLLN